jgi:ferredoxin/flavodoxin---NADP+ reductase
MMEVPHGFVKGTVTDRIDWTDNEFSLMINAPIEPYLAGQFTKLALPNDSGEWVRRAYSLVNSPHHKKGHQQMEFLFIAADGGELSPRLQQLVKGDDIYVAKKASGFMTLAEIPENMTDLWLLSTGSAIGPFLGILDELETASRFEKIVLVHAVRTQAELVYQDKIAQKLESYKGKLHYLPIVSREQCDGLLHGRIPDLLLSGILAERAQVELKKDSSFFYICGNPNMVKDTSAALNKLGYSKNLRRKPGNFSSENYW